MLSKSEKAIVNLYKKETVYLLNKFGIGDLPFQIKIKNPTNSNWVAMYRAGSQFRNSGRGPIFWLSRSLLEDKKQFILSVLHELGHVIAEYAYLTKQKEICDTLSKYWEGEFHYRPWNEEEFAEEFAMFVYGYFCLDQPHLNKVIEEYNISLG